MEWRLGIISTLIIGLFLPIALSNAVVIVPTDALKSNDEIHQRIFFYSDLARSQNLGYQKNSEAKKLSKELRLNNRLLSADTLSDDEDEEDPNLTNFPLHKPDIKLKENFFSLPQSDALMTHSSENDLGATSVGSFLDSFKDDAALRTIYFTSKDLKFSYRKNVANILNLGFQMGADDYKNNKHIWAEEQKKLERELTGSEKKNINLEANSIFVYIATSYKKILYTLLFIVVSLYIIFRYILNRYI